MSQSSLPFPLVRDLEQPKVPRRWYFCPAYIGIVETRDLFVVCKQCDRYAIWCCQHRDTSRSANSCHHYRLAYVDGACSSNGAGNASAGLGVALGNDAEDQFSIDVSDVETNVNAPRTSQRAELLAAVQVLKEAKKDNLQPTHSIIRSYSREDSERPTLVIASDSEYVVRGITEWFPSWKVSSIEYLSLQNTIHSQF
jgi:ribonuclease HI